MTGQRRPYKVRFQHEGMTQPATDSYASVESAVYWAERIARRADWVRVYYRDPETGVERRIVTAEPAV